MEATFCLRFLGTVQIEQDGKPVPGFRSRKALALLGYLATQGQPISREHLVDLFWEGQPETRGRANLSWVLNKIGSRLPGCLQSDRHTVQFQQTGLYWSDIDAFELLVARREMASLSAAVELYRGEFLADLYLDGCSEFDIWLVGERERWRQRAAGALDELIARHNRSGEVEQSLQFARRLLLLEPWREETHQQVMRLLARSGQRSAALAQYEACRRTLAQELNVKPMRDTTALYERVRAADETRRHELPAQPTPFIGREKELAEVIGLLDKPDCRLLTLAGPGGIGKTRLALQAATARLDAFLEGVHFVPLAGVSSAEFLVSAIAGALRFAFFGSQDPCLQLVNYLRGKEMLLILDNMEHLLGGSTLLVEILQQAPEVKLLVTSRERLNLRWEWCFEVEGLEYPPGNTINDQSLEAYSAVQLFQQVARQTCVQSSLSACAPLAMARICQLVEGMPLGIELAAAWVGTRTCEEIAAEIQYSLDLLATCQRDVPERHRSVRATFEHSWHLLTLHEQRVLMKLSVFHRAFQRQAACQVAGATPLVLKSLVDKSLLRCTPPGQYEMHELLRQYAAEKLAAAPQAQTEANDLHCAYYTEFLQSQEGLLARAGVAQAIAAIKTEIENVRAAWRWAVSQARLPEIEHGLNSLSRFYFLAGPYQEGEATIGLAVERVQTLIDKASQPDPDTRVVLIKLLTEQVRFLNRRGMCEQAIAAAQKATSLAALDDTTEQASRLKAAGYLQWGQSLWGTRDYAAARARLEQALTLARAVHLQQVEADSLNGLGLVCWHLSDYEGARAYLGQALGVFREISDRKGESESLVSFGCVCGYQDDHAGARAYFERALDIFREVGDQRGISVALVNLGLVANQQGDYAGASSSYQQGLRISHEIGDRPGEGLALINLGYAADQQGDCSEAEACYQQASRIYREIGDRQGESLTLACLCLLSHHQGENAAACEYGQQALLMAQEIGNRHVQAYALTRLGHALMGLRRLEEATGTYRQALALRRELGQTRLAMDPLAGLARLALAQGDLPQARAYAAEILNHLEKSSLDGADEPCRVYLTCYRVLCAVQDSGAQAILSKAHGLLQARAARIGDEELRRSFLENVAAHREIAHLFLAQCTPENLADHALG